MFEKVRFHIVDILGCEEKDVTLEADLFKTLGADSLDAVELNMAFEEAFGYAIPDEELPNIKTVADIIALLERQAA